MKEAPDPMPGLLARIDDPWGVSWRVVNGIRRLSLGRGLRVVGAALRGARFERPVFVLGAPRSGTTLVFRVLAASEELGSLPGEGHDLWRTYHHPRRSGWRSDAVGAEDVGLGERRFVNAYLRARFDAPRFVEKTPENSLRVEYLRALFDDASFVVVRRNPCDVISSLINGWRHPSGRYRSYFVPADLRIPGYAPRRQWCFALIEGWRAYARSPIPEIAFAQWEQYTRALAAARRSVAPSKWTEVYLERVLEDPGGALSLLCERVGVEASPAMARRLEDLVAEPVNALSPPRHQKWREENGEEIRKLLPQIALLAPEAGYAVDPETGEFDLAG